MPALPPARTRRPRVSSPFLALAAFRRSRPSRARRRRYGVRGRAARPGPAAPPERRLPPGNDGAAGGAGARGRYRGRAAAPGAGGGHRGLFRRLAPPGLGLG